jgi:hypothetical protein
LEDLKRVATSLGRSKISSREYNDNGGKYTAGTIGTRFGSWNNALIKAGLQLVHQREVSSEELWKNLEEVWVAIGRQPVIRDIESVHSKYSKHQYIAKFENWNNALVSFVDYINSGEATYIRAEIITEDIQLVEKPFKHLTKRFPSERVKVQVLMRDGNKCRLCGIILTGDNIHFDHITPWSKGGETLLENLQILCKRHNLAKGDLDYQPE